MTAQKVLEGCFRRAVIALQQIAVGRLVELLGADVGLSRCAGLRAAATCGPGGGVENAVDLVPPGIGRNRHGSEARALRLGLAGIDLSAGRGAAPGGSLAAWGCTPAPAPSARTCS